MTKPLPAGECPTPPHIFRLPRFQKAHDELVAVAALNELDTVERWRLLKSIIREASKIARGESLIDDTDSVGNVFMTYT